MALASGSEFDRRPLSDPIRCHGVVTAVAVVIDKRLGLALDLVSGRVVCARCWLDTLGMERVVVLPSFLSPEMVIAGMVCRSCQHQQAITIEKDSGAVVLGTSLPRS
jgi:hypothetical protein